MTTSTPASTGRLSALLGSGDRLLRLALRADALVTGVNGLAYLALSGPLESLLGLDRGVALGLGAFLLVYAVAVTVVGLPVRVNGAAVLAVIGANAAWAVGSVVVVLTGVLGLTAVGSVWAILQALVVGGFAAAQYEGLRTAG
ncbi:MAG TPA: hypothetical protein VK083_03925 [Nocardia sp.]|uniref:hypothetical protein n=1 Tax=Nocardia TaxID=1817 RepID=UPI00245465F6|nr:MULTISPECIES: hypothetical protein [Nocardia]HLS75926.1 hypothetical protein [Nocardia sp.]